MTEPSPAASSSKRRRVLAILTAVFLLAGALWGAYWFLFLRGSESTEDAYVGGHMVAVTSQVAGTVIAVGADDTNAVKAGQIVVRLDPADAHVWLEQAESELAKMVRQVRNAVATVARYKAEIGVRRAELARARDDVTRRSRLVERGAISQEEARHAAEAQRAAEAALISAEGQAAAAEALVDGTDVSHHPDVANAAAKVREAYLALARTGIPAPIAGVVARRTVQVGTRVNPGMPLMSVIALNHVWVDANFKEGQLADMRIGQPAKITADLYGSTVVYHGKVVGFGAGTGSAFALLPPQNATGNWVKVVQRLPARIALDPQEVAAHPLAIGLSMQVEVDTSDRSGARAAPAPGEPTETKVFEDLEGKANGRIAAIIAANMGAAKE